MSKRRRRRRWRSAKRLRQIDGMVSFYHKLGIYDTDVIASKLECPRKLVERKKK